MNDADLLDAFVALFAPLEELIYPDPVFPVSKKPTDVAAIKPLYACLPAKFPYLYERLVLSYRWQRSDIRDGYRLLANPHGSDLSGLMHDIFRDKGLSDALLPNGFIQFGFQSAYEYDPICFLTDCRSQPDYPIVRIDHEEILCNCRIKVIAIIADSFREFVQKHVTQTDQ
jgi:hypothetical protein